MSDPENPGSTPEIDFEKNKADIERIRERLARHKLRAAELTARAHAEAQRSQEQSTQREATREDFMKAKEEARRKANELKRLF